MSTWRRAFTDALAAAGQFQEFRRAHPGAELSHPDGLSQIYVPYGSDSVTVTRGTTAEAMAAAEEKLAEGDS